MKIKDLLAFTRQQLRDTKPKYRWSDEELLDFLTEGEEKAARNGRLIRDASTAEICRITLTPTKQGYKLDPRIVFVDRVLPSWRPIPLAKRSYKDLDQDEPGWVGRAGTPDKWCQDYETGKLWLNKLSNLSGSPYLTLMVIRLPLQPLTLSRQNEQLELPVVSQHRPVHHWACYRALEKPDEENQDLEQAEIHRAKFIAEFGDDSTASDEEWARTHYGEDDMEAHH